MSTRIRLLMAATSLTALVALSACATSEQTTGPGDAGGPRQIAATTPAPPSGEVIAQGMLREDENGTQLCLGAIAESYPPQCSGIPATGFSWDDIDGDESESGVTWGMYAVQGTYDGASFAITQQPIMLALFDPAMSEDPTGGQKGTASDADLIRMQEELTTAFGADALGSFTDNGWLHLSVIWDDGTIQDAADAVYGEGAVIVESALRLVG